MITWFHVHPAPAGTSSSADVCADFCVRRSPPSPGEDPRDVRVDHRHVALERERQDGPRRVRADSGQRQECIERVRQASAVRRRHPDGGLVEMLGASRIPQTLPPAQHVAERRSRASLGCREHTEERLPLRNHAIDLRLLQHHLGDEDPPRITLAPPRKIAHSRNTPGEDEPGVDHVQSAQTSMPSYGRLRSGAASRFQTSTFRLK